MPLNETSERAVLDLNCRLFRELVDHSAVATAIAVGPELMLAYVNDTYQALAPGKQMRGRTAAEVWPEVMEELGPLLQRALAGARFEAQNLRLDLESYEGGGTQERYFSFSYEPIRFSGEPGVLIQAIETTDSVIARHAAEQYAQSAEHRAAELDRLLERVTDGFFALDRDWRFTYLNRRAEQMLGRQRHELLGKVVWEEFPEAAVTGFHEAYHRAMNEQRLVEFEEVYEPLDLAVQVRAYPNPDGLSVFFVDLGERRRREAELVGLRQRAETLARYMEDSSQPFAAGTAEGVITMVNPAFGKLVGYSEEELLDPEMTFERLTPPEWRETELEVIERLVRTGEPQRYQKEYLRRDGSRVPADVLLHVVLDDEGRPVSFYSFMTDITERERSDRLKEALNEIDTLVHSTLEFDIIMHRALRAAGRALRAANGVIVMYDNGDATVRYSYPDDAVPIGTKFTEDQTPITRRLRERKEPLVVSDVRGHELFRHPMWEEGGVRAFLAIPLVVRGEAPAGLSLGFSEVKEFSDADIDFLRKLASSISLALENAKLFAERSHAFRQLAEKDAAIRQAYSDVIDAATGGRLILVQPEELESELGQPVVSDRVVESAEQFAAERRVLRGALVDARDVDDLVLAFGEALTNAIKHAGPSTYSVRRRDGRLQVVVSDSGGGIDFGRLPKATLVPGFSTKQTLGLGFTLMLELADRLVLCTGPEGTTVVIEQLV